MTEPKITEAYPHRWAGLAVLAGSLLVVVMDMTILNVAVPELARDLRPDSVQLLWIVDAYSLVLAGLIVVASAIGDRWGRRRMLVSGYLIFGTASALVLLVESPAAMIAQRALLGVGGALIMPSTLSLIRVMFTDPRERAAALGAWGSTAGIGAGLGPIIGGVLVEAFSWQAAFLINVPIMALAAVAALRLLPESVAERAGALDLPATAASIVGMVALVYAVKDLSKDGFEAPGLIAAAIALLTLAWFVHRCLSQSNPMLELRLFRSPSFSAGTLAALAAMLGVGAVLLLGAQWLQLVEGRSPIVAGLLLLPAAVGGMISSLAAPVLSPRVGTRPVITGALVVAAAGMLLFYLAPNPLPIGWGLVAFALVGVGTGSLALGSAMIMAATPVERAGNAAALEEISYDLGSTLGVAVLGSVAAARYRDLIDGAALAPPGPAGEAVSGSLAGALEVASGLGPAGQALAESARTAFTDSLGVAGLVAAGILLVAAIVVWVLIPRGLDVTQAEH